MSANGTINIAWDNGEDEFCVAKVDHMLDLEDKCGAAISTIFSRLGDGSWRLNDVRETIRLGLIGGGMPPEKALTAVRRHVDGNPLMKSVMIAYRVLGAALVGVEGDPLGKAIADRVMTEASSQIMDASSDPQSTASAPPSDSIPAPSIA